MLSVLDMQVSSAVRIWKVEPSRRRVLMSASRCGSLAEHCRGVADYISATWNGPSPVSARASLLREEGRAERFAVSLFCNKHCNVGA